MKVVPQIITFLVLVAIGWYTYDSHEPFRKLVDDIVEVAGVTGEYSSAPKLTAAPTPIVAVSQPEKSPASENTAQVTDNVRAEAPSSPVAASSMAESKSNELSEQGGPERDANRQETAATEPDQTTELAQATTVESASVQPVKSEPVVTFAEESVPTAEAARSQAEVSPEKTMVKTPSPADDAPVQPVVRPVQPETVKKDDQQVIAEHMQARKENALAGLAAAREAWHRGNHDKAISLYIKLMREYQNHPDFPGELGNIYFSRGQMEFAVKAYAEAFYRLVGNNDLQRAQKVLRVVYNLDQEKAYELKEYLMR